MFLLGIAIHESTNKQIYKHACKKVTLFTLSMIISKADQTTSAVAFGHWTFIQKTFEYDLQSRPEP